MRILGMALVVAVACRPDVAHAPVPVAHPAQASHVDRELVRTLAILATRHALSPAELDGVAARLDAGTLTLPAYIDTLLASRAFTDDVAPLVILRALSSSVALAAPHGFVLQHTAGATPIYYLHEPCAAAQAVQVKPWWDLDHPVAVCPDSYLPAKWVGDVPKGQPETGCLSITSMVWGYGCGCGPVLERCFPSAERKAEMGPSLQDEIRRSVAHATTLDRPLAEIFTSNATWRDRNAEFIRRTQIIEAHRDPDPEAYLRELASWPAGGKWAPRDELLPGQHAGIVTAPQVLGALLDQRQRMTTFYDLLWCMEADSAGATPEGIAAIAKTQGTSLQLAQDGWKELAARTPCTNCHARLDYGNQFFQGYPTAYLKSYYVPAEQLHGRGALYGTDIQDPRGEAELTPRGFVGLALTQPEFRRCMARDFVGYTFGGRATPEQLDAIESLVNPETTTVKQLMRATLLQLVAEWPRLAAPSADVAATPATPAHGPLAVTGELAHALGPCLDCHDHEPGRPDLSAHELDRDTAIAAIDAVAFGTMPKGHPLSRDDRAAFVRPFIAALWSGADQTAARTFFLGRMTSLPAYRPEIAFGLVHEAAGAPGAQPWRMIETTVGADAQMTSPGLLTTVGLEAIESCRATHHTRDEIDRCIEAATRLERIAPDPHR
jgi:hypothetical protein